MRKTLSTRRAFAEEKQAQRQALVVMVISIVVLLVFVVIMVPLIFNFVIRWARQSGDPSLGQDTLPPQRPVIQPLPDYLTKKETEIIGYTEAGAKVVLTLNDSEAEETMADQDGAFKFNALLQDGENVLWVVAEDEAGNSSDLSDTLRVTVDSENPSLQVDSPQDGQTFTLPKEKVLTVSGKMSEKGEVLLNGSRVRTDDEGAFSTSLSLGDGENTLTFKAVDEAGNESAETVIKVNYKP